MATSDKEDWQMCQAYAEYVPTAKLLNCCWPLSTLLLSGDLQLRLLTPGRCGVYRLHPFQSPLSPFISTVHLLRSTALVRSNSFRNFLERNCTVWKFPKNYEHSFFSLFFVCICFAGPHEPAVSVIPACSASM